VSGNLFSVIQTNPIPSLNHLSLAKVFFFSPLFALSILTIVSTKIDLFNGKATELATIHTKVYFHTKKNERD
jgi:hypothetical protein